MAFMPEFVIIFETLCMQILYPGWNSGHIRLNFTFKEVNSGGVTTLFGHTLYFALIFRKNIYLFLEHAKVHQRPPIHILQ